VEQALAGGGSSSSPPKGATKTLAGLVALGLGLLVALAAVGVAIVLIVRWAI